MYNDLQRAGQALANEIGVEWRDVPQDGRWYEVPVVGKDQRNCAGRIKLFPDGEGGHVWNHITSEQSVFWAHSETTLDPAEREARRKRAEDLRRQAETERQRSAKEAAGKAVQLWKAAGSPDGNPYLLRKGVSPVASLRQIDSEAAAAVLGYAPKDLTGPLLVVPVKVAGRWSSVQLIAADGRKHFLAGGILRGGFWATGKLPDGDGSGLTILIAEGVATALSCCAATGYLAVAAMSCGNLRHVAADLRKQYRAARLIVASDKGNGEHDACRAATESGAALAVPEIDGDGSDYNDLHTVSGLNEVRRQIERAADLMPPPPSTPVKEIPDLETAPESRICVVAAADFMARKFPPRENLLSPWMACQGLAMIYGPRGLGKTHMSLGVAYAVASGGSFLAWRAPAPRGVLFIDGEMPGVVLQERLARIVASNDKEPGAPLRIVTPDLQPSGMIDISRTEDQRELAPYLDGIDLIILDNLSTLVRSGKESEGESWLPVQEWALQQRAAGRSVLFMHHSGKNGEQRGSSRREDVLDTVIALKRPGDYTPAKGACFEVHFEKARGIYGEATRPFETQLFTGPDGTQTWAVKPLEESTAEKVAALLNEGIPQIEIADMLSLTKGAISKAKQKARELGLLKAA